MKFVVKLGDGSDDILKKLHTIYGDGALKATVVYKWVACYKEWRESLEEDPHSGRPVSTHNDENVNQSRIVTLQKYSRLIEKQYV